MMEDLKTVNLINSMNFTTNHSKSINKTQHGDFWIKTNAITKKSTASLTQESEDFISRHTAKNLIIKPEPRILSKETNTGDFRCINSNEVYIDYTIQLDLKSGNTVSTKC